MCHRPPALRPPGGRLAAARLFKPSTARAGRVQRRLPGRILARHGGTVVTSQALIAEVWGPARVDDTRNLRVFIKSLRGKLEPEPGRPRYIVPEAGIGYRLNMDSMGGEIR